MQVDTVILSNTKTIAHYGNCCRAVNSMKASEDAIDFKISVVESNVNYLQNGFVHYGCNAVVPNEDFNYNRFLNIGLKDAKSEWIVVANNDVIFTKNWFSKLMRFAEKNPQYKSLSPYEPNWHANKQMSNDVEYYSGYRTSFEITGWCLVIHASVIKQCNLFDERFKFWYQDNDYAETLKHANVPHALVTGSRVYHEISQSYDVLSNKQLQEMTHAQLNVFNKKWGV